MLSDKKGALINTYVPDYCIFDLETTGVNVNADAVIEISAIRVRGGNAMEEFSMLVNPGFPIPFEASDVNRITDDMVAGQPDFEHAFQVFMDFVGNDVLVGHNIHTFDMKFLQRDAQAFWGKQVGNDYIDTLKMAKRYLPGLRHYRLSDLALHYGIRIENAHRALGDCRMNVLIYEKLRGESKNPSKEALNVEICPRCGSPLKMRNGRYGMFWGCTGYPECRFTRDVGS